MFNELKLLNNSNDRRPHAEAQKRGEKKENAFYEKNIILFVIFCLFMNTVFADPPINVIALDHYNKGMQHYSANTFDLAIIEFTSAIDIFPEYADAYLERGNCYDNKGDDEKALENYLQASAYDEKYLIFTYGYECASDKIKNYDDAIIAFSRCIELETNTFIAYCMRGNSYCGKENYEKAISDYNAAIRISPNIFQPYFSRASMNTALMNFDLAILDYEKSVELCPDYHLAYYALSVLYQMKGNTKKAKEMMMLFENMSKDSNI